MKENNYNTNNSECARYAKEDIQSKCTAQVEAQAKVLENAKEGRNRCSSSHDKMIHDLTLVLINLVKFLALEHKARYRLLSATATPFAPQGLGRIEKREEAELCTKLESIIKEQIDRGRIF